MAARERDRAHALERPGERARGGRHPRTGKVEAVVVGRAEANDDHGATGEARGLRVVGEELAERDLVALGRQERVAVHVDVRERTAVGGAHEAARIGVDGPGAWPQAAGEEVVEALPAPGGDDAFLHVDRELLDDARDRSLAERARLPHPVELARAEAGEHRPAENAPEGALVDPANEALAEDDLLAELTCPAVDVADGVRTLAIRGARHVAS